MKTNHKENETVTITEPKSRFYELTGKVVSNTPELNKPLKVDLSPYGVWSFKYDEVQPQKVNNSTESLKIALNQKEEPTTKRGYKKREAKPKEVKEKRKYTKKSKQ